MIEVIGTTQLSFMFPADRVTAYRYYLDMQRVAQFLPHIHYISNGPERHHRLKYETVELGAYRICIFCDVRSELDADYHVLQFVPSHNEPQVPHKAGINKATARGFYGSVSRFYSEGDQTRVEYELKLQATLPTPLALRLVPEAVLNKIANNVTSWRIKEIAGGFIDNSIASFPQWMQQNPR